MSFSSTLPIYIGYEEREHDAYEVCRYSILRNSRYYWGESPQIHKLRSQDIKSYHRDHGEPQSTDFTFTRFWVPWMENFKGFSVFVDCDFLFLDSIFKLFEEVDKSKAVSVVKHPEYIPLKDLKMDGIPQHKSKRKNWASLMVFNNEHPKNQILIPQYLNEHVPGIDFHHFKWLDDEDIGELPLDWNCLDQYYKLRSPKAIHYTEGGPWFGPEFNDTTYGYLWNEYDEMRVSDSHELQ